MTSLTAQKEEHMTKLNQSTKQTIPDQSTKYICCCKTINSASTNDPKQCAGTDPRYRNRRSRTRSPGSCHRAPWSPARRHHVGNRVDGGVGVVIGWGVRSVDVGVEGSANVRCRFENFGFCGDGDTNFFAGASGLSTQESTCHHAHVRVCS